ncbi:CRISPR-associated protein Csx16 [Vibrio alfacsensis]|uniref:CRISPR-associated protein Csx16 n=1 Tax=Vibrio alfacsensis TaxID=1074311 RepID=A0ABN5PCH0_9VIBR|nr:CRISPR-associated protein Csx16 [Vibrio alfacsensis]AXY00918.1 CRISPR-associated protein Csx16 [Vibrio alfacsensis]
MKTYFVTRHPATKAWAKDRQMKIDHWLEHISDLTLFNPGDVVYGTLPIQMAAQLCKQGVRYGHFTLIVPPHLRGLEFSAEQLQSCQPKIEFFEVMKVG